MAEVERRASAYGLPPIAWPDPWPGNTLVAMRVATFAKQTGRTVSFALAAFRQAFAAGRDLSDPDNVLIAAAACELHPRALLKAVETRGGQGRPARGDRRGRRAGRDRRPLPGRRRARSSGATTEWRKRSKRRAKVGCDGRPARRRHLLRAAREDGADPPLRGGGGTPVPAGEGRRLPAPGDRRGGDDRRHRLGDARGGLPDRHLPHPRPRDRPRRRPQAGDGRAVRPGRRDQRRPRRLDAHLRPRRTASWAATGSSAATCRSPPASPSPPSTRAKTRSPSACSATAPPTPATSARR